MGMRGKVAGVVSDLLSFAALAKSLASGSLRILEHQDDQDADECEWYGNPALQCRPPAGADVIFADLDGERVVFGVRESRWQVAIEEGETVLRALGSGTPAYVKLKTDGSMELHGNSIKLGDETATAPVALANLCAVEFAKIALALNALAGPGTYTPVSVASTKVRAQ